MLTPHNVHKFIKTLITPAVLQHTPEQAAYLFQFRQWCKTAAYTYRSAFTQQAELLHRTMQAAYIFQFRHLTLASVQTDVWQYVQPALITMRVQGDALRPVIPVTLCVIAAINPGPVLCM